MSADYGGFFVSPELPSPQTSCWKATTFGATLLSALGETTFLKLDANDLLGETAQGFNGQITVGLAF